MAQHFVAVLMGSDSDLATMENCIAVLRRFGVRFEVRIASAHRTPDATRAYVQDAEQRGCGVYIAAAGMAAHLAGAVAASTCKPVIGVPMEVSLGGLDALLSTAQMPGGIPVATVAVGNAGATNAGYLAVQILALDNAELATALREDRASMTAAVEQKNRALQDKLGAA